MFEEDLELINEVRQKFVAHYSADSQVSVCGGDGLSGNLSKIFHNE